MKKFIKWLRTPWGEEEKQVGGLAPEQFVSTQPMTKPLPPAGQPKPPEGHWRCKCKCADGVTNQVVGNHIPRCSGCGMGQPEKPEEEQVRIDPENARRALKAMQRKLKNTEDDLKTEKTIRINYQKAYELGQERLKKTEDELKAQRTLASNLQLKFDSLENTENQKNAEGNLSAIREHLAEVNGCFDWGGTPTPSKVARLVELFQAQVKAIKRLQKEENDRKAPDQKGDYRDWEKQHQRYYTTMHTALDGVEGLDRQALAYRVKSLIAMHKARCKELDRAKNDFRTLNNRASEVMSQFSRIKSLDLTGYTPEKAKKVVDAFLEMERQSKDLKAKDSHYMEPYRDSVSAAHDLLDKEAKEVLGKDYSVPNRVKDLIEKFKDLKAVKKSRDSRHEANQKSLDSIGEALIDYDKDNLTRTHEEVVKDLIATIKRMNSQETAKALHEAIDKAYPGDEPADHRGTAASVLARVHTLVENYTRVKELVEKYRTPVPHPCAECENYTDTGTYKRDNEIYPTDPRCKREERGQGGMLPVGVKPTWCPKAKRK